MTLEVSVAIIAFSLVAWMVILLILLLQTRKSLESLKKDIHNTSTEAIQLFQKVQELIKDIQSKSDSLDVVFRPLKAITKGRSRSEHSDTVSEIFEFVGSGLTLFNKIKNAVKHRGK